MPFTKQKSFGAIVHEKLVQYELMTAVYIMEPWEKTLFNIIAIVIMSLSLTTFYQYTLFMVTKLVGLVI